MANRISLREFTDMEDLYVKEDVVSLVGLKAAAWKPTEHAPARVYFLLDDSRVMLLNVRVYGQRRMGA